MEGFCATRSCWFFFYRGQASKGLIANRYLVAALKPFDA
jgi:hypothetical protein